MSIFLQDRFTAMLRVRTRDELLDEAVRFTKTLGFVTISAMAIFDRGHVRPAFHGVHNTPIGFREAYADMEYAQRDPVAQHCKDATVPIIWGQDTYTSIGEGERWELQAGFGYCTGIALATHLPGGRHFFIGVDRDQSLPQCPSEVSRMLGDLYLFAAHVQEALFRMLRAEASEHEDAPVLTPRELECLRWTMEGKTAWEVGRILAISEQTAVRHINNATRKLGCLNKLQAVLKALRMELIR